MVKPQRRQDIGRVLTTRPGEGVLISVDVRTDARTDGKTHIGFGFDLSQAPVPERQYVANAIDVVYQEDSIALLVGQRKLSSTDLRSLLVITITPEKAQHFLESIDEMHSPSVEDIVKLSHLNKLDVTPVSVEPEQTFAMVSNVIGAAISGAETCLDFYHVSSFAVLAVQGSHKLALNPVVRVHLHTSLFAAAIAKMRMLLAKHQVVAK
jgi:hypothetical protein